VQDNGNLELAIDRQQHGAELSCCATNPCILFELLCTMHGNGSLELAIDWQQHGAELSFRATNPSVLFELWCTVQGNGSLELAIDRQQHGAELSCRATNPALPDHHLQDTLVLQVYCKLYNSKPFYSFNFLSKIFKTQDHLFLLLSFCFV
jgi:hypothetical protein